MSASRSVAVIGARGFVGSAFVETLSGKKGLSVHPVGREDYDTQRGRRFDIVVDCSANSRKYLADEQPAQDFERSVTQRLRTLSDFGAGLHVHISSVDVYSDLSSPDSTREDAILDASRSSRYGFHKWLAELLVRHDSPQWLIVRLAGMVGRGLRKNPVYDVLHGEPLRIHPDSRYQFLDTHDVAEIAWRLVERGFTNEVFNVCGDGLITPREVAALAGRRLDLSEVAANSEPRVVDVNIEKLRQLMPVPSTRDVIVGFVSSRRSDPPSRSQGGST